MTSAVSSASLHEIQNTALDIAPGINLTDLQKRHIGLVLEMFQAKGTIAKIDDGFTEVAVYEDLFATAQNRREVAGQFLGLPIVTKSSTTVSHLVESATAPTPPATAYELHVKIHQCFVFKPLGTEVNMKSTLVIFSDEAKGKITRLQDRPMEEIPDNSLLYVSISCRLPTQYLELS